MDLRKAFAQNLRLQRANAGLSQEELADRAELDRTYISALERCLYSASLDTIERVARALRIEPFELLRRSPRPPRNGRGDKAG
jgi:transcriptional regulator with XRE-family HTH domain